MTETQIDTGITGAKRQSWRKANPRDILKRLLDADTELSEDEARNECWEKIHKDEGLLRSVYDYWFDNNYRSLVKPAPTPGAAQRRKAAVDAIAQNIGAQIEQKIEARVKIALLDMTLPTGKALRHSTREELTELGGWAARVAEKLAPSQTVAEAGLSEAQLRELYEPAE
jgi:hypothetical protein